MITVEKKLKRLIPYRIVWFPNEAELGALASDLKPVDLVRVECAHVDLGDARCMVEHHLSVTLRVDLRRPLEDVMGAFHSTARKRVRQAERFGDRVAIRRYAGGAENARMLDEFVVLFNKLVEHKHGAMFPISRGLVESFFPNAELAMVDFDGKPTFGRLSLCDPRVGVVRHLYAASRRFESPDAARVTAIIHVYLNWSDVQTFRVAGYTTLDLGGISPIDDPGINRFKLQFGGAIARHHSYLVAGMPSMWRAAFGLFTTFTDKGKRRRAVERAGDQWKGVPLEQIRQLIHDACVPVARSAIGGRA